jgi:hypothetical protein
MKAPVTALTAALALALPASSTGQPPPTRTEPARQPVVVNVSAGGFRWGDAAIGAAAASGVALGLAGVSMFRRQLQKEER